MFFSISHNQHEDFNCHWNHGAITVNTDSGWSQIQLEDHYVVYKGYAETGKLVDLIPTILSQHEPSLLGNFCVIAIDQHKIQIKTDRYRGFTIWADNEKEITNLKELTHAVWTDSILEADLNLNITEDKFDVIGSIDTTELTETEVLDRIDQRFLERTLGFVNYNTLPVKSFLSGGVDSLLAYSYLKRVDAEVEVVEYFHVDYDHFWRSNAHHLKKFWAYKQIHHWTTPTVIASGAPGDELMLRSPTTTSMYLQSLNINLMELINNNPTCLHHDHFLKPKSKELIERPYHAVSKDQTAWEICNILMNDCQHWHIGNTLSWTLLRDIEVTKLLLRLPLESAVGQILNSDISKKLIERNIPGATAWISDQKNIEPIRKNLNRRIETRNAF